MQRPEQWKPQTWKASCNARSLVWTKLGQDDRHSYYGVLEHGDGSITVYSSNSQQNHSEPSYENSMKGIIAENTWSKWFVSSICPPQSFIPLSELSICLPSQSVLINSHILEDMHTGWGCRRSPAIMQLFATFYFLPPFPTESKLKGANWKKTTAQQLWSLDFIL